MVMMTSWVTGSCRTSLLHFFVSCSSAARQLPE